MPTPRTKLSTASSLAAKQDLGFDPGEEGALPWDVVGEKLAELLRFLASAAQALATELQERAASLLGALASMARFALPAVMNLSRTHIGDGACSTLRLKIDVDRSGGIEPSPAKATAAASFQHPSDSSALLGLMKADEARSSGYIKNRNETMTVECTISVFNDILQVPSTNLPKHLGALLESKVGADVTFSVSGESFAAHKNVLAARSPVFMAEFFGEMQEKTSRCVKICGMEPSAFGAMLRFIYTDAVPELAKMEAASVNLAQHLLVAADRYQLDRLKVFFEHRLSVGMDTSTAATTLALAERHGCSQLKIKCVEFIAGGSSENLDAVMKTEGFKDLMLNSPTLLAELLVAAHGRKK